MTPRRRGWPAPLVAHLAAAAEIYEYGARLAPAAASEKFPWSAAPNERARRILRAASEAPAAELAVAVRAEGLDRMRAMIRGLRAYKESPHRRDLPSPPVIWRSGAARLLDFGPPDGRVCVVAPSLINSPDILDIDAGRSLLRWLSRRGVRPLLLDWGAPGEDEAGFDLGEYVRRRLSPAVDAARAFAGDDAVALVGYCMGGTLATALAATRPEAVDRLALVGAPWDFERMTPMRAALASLGVAGDRAALTRMIEAAETVYGVAPTPALQAVFAQLDPGLAARKFRRFADLPADSDAARRFVLVEDWLNDGPPLSAPAAREALIDWHLDNAPMRGRWRVGDRAIDPAAIAAPTLVVAAADDRIATPAAATALARAIPISRLIEPRAGHVGMIVGRDAMRQLWAPLADFLLR